MVIKKYKLIFNGCCGMIILDFVEIMIDQLEKFLFVFFYKKGGCNN